MSRPNPHNTAQIALYCRIIRDREAGLGAWEHDAALAVTDPEGYAAVRVRRVTATAVELLARLGEMEG